ncbi:response regulator transcription factor [[Clostridium] polysaccharolyticum]|uniref:Stage 0 sporulation protein A homolog n=1 Tax=[Clostridium] polysaccharolyticum TaxID=29364 RepID=A0A1H9ZMR5_9FIRM|nr:response regulator [[Clostridium] polysaccharolyticum]SES82914.1 two-component system, response regulator YesN [[Clostridium] polysaccharolyticum]
MLRVLLVDDEPFILKGLKVLIDWNREGFEIAGTASNGEEALEFVRHNQVDLIMSDIKMPVMTGLELLKRIREENITDAYFVIVSGYADFSYAQQAMQYKCTNYILKPVKEEELVEELRKIAKLSLHQEQEKEDTKKMEQAYLARNVISLIHGNYDKLNLQYVEENMKLSEQVRYIEIALDDTGIAEELSDEEKWAYQRELYKACVQFLKKYETHCIFNVSGHEKVYDIGFVYCDYMATEEGINEEEYLKSFLSCLKETLNIPILMLAGKKVKGIANIAKSYSTACMLRSVRGFRVKKEIYDYEDEVQVTNNGIVLCKKSLDSLLAAIEQNNRSAIQSSVEQFYGEMQQMEVAGDIVTLNINYILFQLIHLAISQDDNVNQEEILRLISESSFEEGIKRGSRAHLTRFAYEYADYLAQLRKNVSHGVLADIDKEIREHYSENITLKQLSEKYYVNSAYLGQLFRKRYGQSFKDYLIRFRMEQAVIRLIRTDKKIYEIAEEVGYKDLDYFVNRFIDIKGCTPAKFRKQTRCGEI